MPAIPNVPGVPALTSYSLPATVLLVGDVLREILGPFASQWGIFRNGFPVIFGDNTVSFDFKQDFTIAEYPTERGGFQSYNKVQVPTEIRVRVSCGGSAARRQAFLASISAQMSTIDLYDVLTPEGVYIGYNFTHRDERRTAERGLGLITCDLWLKEVRLTATSTYTNTAQPGVAGGQGLGNVQPQSVDPKIAAAVTPETVQ
jgi:hypothetical protein